jgi:hypothetical protein
VLAGLGEAVHDERAALDAEEGAQVGADRRPLGRGGGHARVAFAERASAGGFGVDRAERRRGALQRRQELSRPRRRHARDRRLQRDAEVRRTGGARHEHGEADETGQELLVVDRHALALHLLQLALEPVEVGQRVRRAALERRVRQQAPALLARHLREEDLAARRAMRGHARAGVQVEAQRRGGLDPVEIDHLVARERGEVAALADLLDEGAQHRPARAVVHVVQEQVLGEAAQARAGAVVAAVALALQQAGVLELLQHAVQRRLRQVRLGDERGQRERPVARGDQLEQRDQAQCRRVAVELDGRRRGGSDDLHLGASYVVPDFKTTRFEIRNVALTPAAPAIYSRRPKSPLETHAMNPPTSTAERAALPGREARRRACPTRARWAPGPPPRRRAASSRACRR